MQPPLFLKSAELWAISTMKDFFQIKISILHIGSKTPLKTECILKVGKPACLGPLSLSLIHSAPMCQSLSCAKSQAES